MADHDHPASHEEQAAAASRGKAIRCAVLTISDSRTARTDTSGTLIEDLLRSAGHLSVTRALVPDEPREIEQQLCDWINDPSLQAILTTGGTGIAKRDTTIDVIRRLLTVELDGFGELFRMLSWNEVGAAAMLSRAVGGLAIAEGASSDDPGTLIFAMPGSPNAVETAMRKLIIPQLPHLVWERTR